MSDSEENFENDFTPNLGRYKISSTDYNQYLNFEKAAKTVLMKMKRMKKGMLLMLLLLIQRMMILKH